MRNIMIIFTIVISVCLLGSRSFAQHILPVPPSLAAGSTLGLFYYGDGNDGDDDEDHEGDDDQEDHEEDDSGGLIMYGVDNHGHNLIRYSLEEDAYDTVGTIHLSGGTVISEVESLGYIPGRLHLYGVWNYLGNENSKLIKIDMFSGEATPMGSDIGYGNIEGLVAAYRSDGSEGDGEGDDEGDDLGLKGGHFDVDTYAGTSRTFHEHQYDDKNDVTFVDLVNSKDLNAEWRSILSGYGSVRISFTNTQSGSGTYRITTSNQEWSGNTRDNSLGTIIVDASDITSLRLDFVSLSDFRGTEPGVVEKDNVDRDDSMCVNIEDLSGNLIYQFSVYEHIKKDGGDQGNGGDGNNGDDNDHHDGDDDDHHDGDDDDHGDRGGEGHWMFYGVNVDTNGQASLIEIDSETGQGQVIMNLSREYEGLAYAGDTFYAVSDNMLWKIDVETGTETAIGQDDFFDIEALEFADGEYHGDDEHGDDDDHHGDDEHGDDDDHHGDDEHGDDDDHHGDDEHGDDDDHHGDDEHGDDDDHHGDNDSSKGFGLLYGFSDIDNALLLIDPSTGAATEVDSVISLMDIEGIVFLKGSLDPKISLPKVAFD